MSDRDQDERWTLRISAAVSTVAAVAIAAHLIWPHLRIDFVTVVLLAVASLPWLRGIVSSVDLPGGASIKLADMRRAVARDQQETIEAIRSVATADTAAPTAEKLAQIYDLADEYERIRAVQPSGHQRTQSMGRSPGRFSA